MTTVRTRSLLIISISYFLVITGTAPPARGQTDSFNTNEIWNYPGSVPMIEAVERLNQYRGASWLSAEAYHTDDSIKDVIRYFQKRTAKVNRETSTNVIVESLKRDNWKLDKGSSFPLGVFIKAEELIAIWSAYRIESALGIIVLEDCIVRVHLISPHPDAKNNRDLIRGTMITIIKERIPQNPPAVAVDEKSYSPLEVTRKARIKNKPTADHPGGWGTTVILKAILGANGKVQGLRIINANVDDAFVQAAIRAARKITFDPAIKDGRYVSQWVQLEYYFRP